MLYILEMYGSVAVYLQYAEVRTAQLINLDIEDTDDMQTQV